MSCKTLFGVTVRGYSVDVGLDEGDHVGAHDALPLREAVGVEQQLVDLEQRGRHLA